MNFHILAVMVIISSTFQIRTQISERKLIEVVNYIKETDIEEENTQEMIDY